MTFRRAQGAVSGFWRAGWLRGLANRLRAAATEREVARLVDRDAPKGPPPQGRRDFV